MLKYIALLFILNITLSTARPLLKQNSDTDFNYSSVTLTGDPITVHRFHFSQRLDHINLQDDRRWRQKYAVTVNYYRKTGPAFLYINGKEPLDKGQEFPDTVLTYAKSLHAICFSLEHRFYGRTRPINGSIINHLSTTQALADIAKFINGMILEFHLPKQIKWITFGCSLGGTLAAWARLKYPHLVHGAVASSAPIVARVDYSEYDQIVEESLKSYDSKCIENIMVAFEEIVDLVISTQNMRSISQMFYLDDDVDKSLIKTYILHTMLVTISNAVQHDMNCFTISSVCKIMIEYNGTKLEALAEIYKLNMECYANLGEILPEESQECQNENSVKNEDWEIDYAWRYQRCSEFGHYSSYTNATFLSAVKHLLIPIETDIEMRCGPFFGTNFSVEKLKERIMHTNSQYGGLNFNVPNTLFIHGSLDPWYKAGLYQKSNASLYETIFIKGASHCTDLAPPDRNIPELANALNKVLKTMKSWL